MKIKLLFLTLLCSAVSWGQVSMSLTGSHVQDFNTLANTGTPSWTDNSTILNWYSQRTGSGTTYAPNTGTTTAGNLYSFGAASPSTERALGTIGSGNAAAGSFAHGVLLRNTSGGVITNITVGYTGEQWRKENVGAQTITFWYKISSSPITVLNPNVNATWTAVTALNFTSPQNNTAAAALDGNLAANRVVIATTSIPSLSLANNDYIMLKWEDPDHTSSDHGLAIDDVTINWTVASSPITPVITSALTASGTQGTPFTYTITANNAPSSYGATGLPAGLSIDTTTGIISGTPSVSGTFNVTITATNGAGTDTETLVITLVTGPCLSANFDASTTVPSGWSGGSANDTAASHYQSAPNCRSLGSASDLISPSTNNPASISFYVDASGSGGQTGTLEYRIGAGAWTSVGTFIASTAGATVIFDLTSSPNLSIQSNVSFRISSGANTIYIDNFEVSCGTPQPIDISVLGGSVVIVDGDTTPNTLDNTDFGSVVVGNNTAKLFSIKNLGTSTLTLTGASPYVAISGANAGDFSVTTIPSNSVASNGTTSFQITFTPSGLGVKTATITIANDDPDENPYNFSIQGNGVATPTYCTASGNMTYNTSITNVTLNTINNTTAKPAAYNDYTAISTTLQRGSTHNVSMRINTDGNYTVLGFVWIDFNRDGDFADAGEAFDMGQTVNNIDGLSSLSPLTITIPLTASLGTTRMRVMATYSGDTSPCLTGFDGEVEDYTITIAASCTPTHTVASFTPNSGPQGTDVLITGTGFTAGTTVMFNGIAATVVFNSSTSITATVPVGNVTGTITVREAGCNLYPASPFTEIISTGACSGASTLTDLFISETYDSLAGNSWYIELYNPTPNAIDLDAVGANYKIVRYGDIGTTNGLRTVDISGIIPSGGVYYADLGTDSSCGVMPFDFINKGNGINENDEIQLTKNDVTVDIVHCPNEKGYTITRKTTATAPSATYIAPDWTLSTGESCANLGIYTYVITNNLPTVTVQPTDSNLCGNTATFSATATPAGGGSLTYSWYYNNGTNNTWSVVSAGTFAGITASGVATNTLNLSGSLSTINGYQFYCLVTQNGVCSVASDAAQLKANTTTWNGTVWSNGAPTTSKVAIIDGTYNTTTHGDFECCSLIVNATRTLTVTATKYVLVVNDITNNGTFNILNNGSLIQVNDLGVNTGNISYERIASVLLQDYVYWSSPVTGFDVNSISPLTPAYYHWLWNPTVANTNGGLGNWQNASTTMTAGQGYIVRAPNGFSNATNQNWTATFNNGVPRNGVYTPTIARGTYTDVDYAGTNGVLITANDDNWNLLGNPYPSAISINSFLLANPQLDGFVRLWTHGTLPVSSVNPFYNSYVYNYTVGDYVALNGSGATSGPGAPGVIGGGQGFFTLMLPGAATTSTATFNNAMRDKGYSNSQFYKTASPKAVTLQEVGGNIERSRIWIDLVSPTMETTRTLMAYVEGATVAKDRMFDALTDYKATQNFYSLLENEVMTIQGRPLPFDVNDQVPMGIKIPTNGTYTIAIAAADGLFAGKAQKIYIEDKLLGTINDITAVPYQFTATQGITNNRFVLRYTNQALSNADYDLANNAVTVFASTAGININSTTESIKGYTVYNVLGQTLAEKNNVNANQSVVNTIAKNNQALIVKIVLTNGQAIIKKVIF